MRNPIRFCGEYKLGTTQNNMMLLIDLGIPEPVNYLYDEFSIRSVAGDKTIYGDGFPSAQWEFLGLTQSQLGRLRQYLSGGSGVVTIRTPTNDILGDMWSNFTAIMASPQLAGPDGKRVGYNVPAYQSVIIHFTGLVSF